MLTHQTIDVGFEKIKTYNDFCTYLLDINCGLLILKYINSCMIHTDNCDGIDVEPKPS